MTDVNRTLVFKAPPQPAGLGRCVRTRGLELTEESSEEEMILEHGRE